VVKIEATFSPFDVNEFDHLCSIVQKCVKCARMCDSQRVLNRSAGSLNADIMFIGEAPGRLGADNSGIPFHGDKSGHNFEELLDFAKLERSIIFVTNAVLCNPKDELGNNSTPTKIEIQNCAQHLAEQIKIINPKIVVTLGATALESTRFTSFHEFNLKSNVRTANNWYNRILIPLYHPGQRAMMHRSFANQRSDYQFVSEQLKRVTTRSSSTKTFNPNSEVIPIVKEILMNLSSVDYFKLHKLYYLIEYNYFKEHQHRLTNAYIVRQKDGPYCTDLHIQKLKKAMPEMEIRKRNGGLFVGFSPNLFNNYQHINGTTGDIIKAVIAKYANLSNEEIKTKVYLTSPMREFLKKEKHEHINLYNVPIKF
jgi:uracil-DNA glycosylase family 4